MNIVGVPARGGGVTQLACLWFLVLFEVLVVYRFQAKTRVGGDLGALTTGNPFCGQIHLKLV